MYQYLNHNNEWPQVRKFGLEVDSDSGAMTLRKLPGPPRSIGCVPGVQSSSPLRAGVAANGSDGTIYVSNPDGNQVIRIDPHTHSASVISCCGNRETSWEVGQFESPHGLAFQACRQRLLVADTGHHRIQVIDVHQERVVAVWGQTWPYEKPRPCGHQDGLDGPEHLACDRSGNVYVIDQVSKDSAKRQDLPDYQDLRDLRRIVKLSADGVVQKVTFDCADLLPVQIAVGSWKAVPGREAPEYVFVLAVRRQDKKRELMLCVFDTDGTRITAKLKLLTSDETIDPGSTSGDKSVGQTLSSSSLLPISSVKYGFDVSPNSGKGAEDRWPFLIRAFTVIGTTAVVALASTPPRVWCFDLGDSIGPQVDEPRQLEPSWLPLYDGQAVALGVRGNPTKSDSADLLLFAGPGRDLFALRHRGAFRTQGAFLAGPFTGNYQQITQWHRLRFDGRMNDAGACNDPMQRAEASDSSGGNGFDSGHVQWFTLSRNVNRSNPQTAPHNVWEPPVRLRADRMPNWFRVETQPDMFAQLQFAAASEADPTDEPVTDEFAPLRRMGSVVPGFDPDRTPPNEWLAIPENQFDALVRNSGGTPAEPADQLWIFGLLAGNGNTSPALYQARLEHDEDGWLPDLPDVYQRHAASRTFLRSVLALMESRFEDATEAIDQLPALFSSRAVSDRYGRHSAELDWLRSTLALPTTPRLGNELPDRQRNKKTFESGTALLSKRGTPHGLRQLIWLATGVDVVIDEPGLTEQSWQLGAPGSASGISLGMPAADGLPIPHSETYCASWSDVLGYTTLSDPDHPQVRLPDDLAHHFVVRGYESDLQDPEVRDLVERIVGQLAPAHNTFTVQVIRPRARLGIQARLGIDSVVAPQDPSDPFTLNETPGPDGQIDPTPRPPIVGAAHLGTQPLM